MSKLLSLVITIVLLSSCAETVEDKLIKGEWITTKWEVKESKQPIQQQMLFHFKNERNYEIDYGNQLEIGKYWISGGFLHTVENGKSEKKVKLVSIDSSEMVLEMNRAGRLETLYLKRYMNQ